MTIQKRELFEILSQTQSHEQTGPRKASIRQTVAPTPTGRIKPVERPPEELPAAAEPAEEGAVGRVLREGINLPLPTAIGLLGVAGALLVTSYLLGMRVGDRNARAHAAGAEVPAGTLRDDDRVTETRTAAAILPAMHVVRISSYPLSEPNLLKAEEEMRFAASDAFVLERRLPVCLFRNDVIYTVSVGAFDNPNDPAITEIVTRFKPLAGPGTSVAGKPFERAAPIQAKLIGKVVSREG